MNPLTFVCGCVQVEQEQGLVFELRTMNRSLQQRAHNLGEDASLDMAHAQPLSLLSEIQQSQVDTPTHRLHVHMLTAFHNVIFATATTATKKKSKVVEVSSFFSACCVAVQAKEALLAHSTVLQAKDEEIQKLTEEVSQTMHRPNMQKCSLLSVPFIAV